VGDPQLDFLGLSYGSFLGAIYVNLFPDKVRRMVLDGNVDPVAWTNGGDEDASLDLALRLGSDKDAAKTLDAFLSLCGQPATSRCAFSAGSASATKAKWRTLLRRLREHPVTVGSPPRTWTYAALVTYVGAESAAGNSCSASTMLGSPAVCVASGAGEAGCPSVRSAVTAGFPCPNASCH
jgi:pimeloyl-ACP methyl ester carboxylesterase